jgi:hypothetical protein
MRTTSRINRPTFTISNDLDMYPKAKKAANEVKPSLEKKSRKFSMHITPEFKWDKERYCNIDTGRVSVIVEKNRTRSRLKTFFLITIKNNANPVKTIQDCLSKDCKVSSTLVHSEEGLMDATKKAIALVVKPKRPRKPSVKKSVAQLRRIVKLRRIVNPSRIINRLSYVA